MMTKDEREELKRLEDTTEYMSSDLAYWRWMELRHKFNKERNREKECK